MRINRQTLLKITEDMVEKRVKEMRSLLAVYLYGSMTMEEEPFLGESTDIDLVFIHEYAIETAREAIPITDEISFDIVHHTRAMYRTPRELRKEPWLGPAIYDFSILHDPRHFLDFVQAGLRDQFFQPGNILARALEFAGAARKQWTSLLMADTGAPQSTAVFIDAAANAANAVASLEGDPLPERRILTRYFERTEAMGQPGLYTRLLELLGAGEIDADDLGNWIAALERAFGLVDVETDPAIMPARRRYHLNALQAQLSSARPADALWPLLRTWSRTAGALPEHSPARQEWAEAMTQIGLLGPGLTERLEQLDSHLDWIEEMLEGWGKTRGVDAY